MALRPETLGEAAGGDRPRRVLVVDDDPLARGAIRAELEAGSGFVVCGEAQGGEQGVELATRLDPDVVLMDVVMPDLDGVAATRRIARAHPGVKIVVLTASSDDELALLALRSGADGFLAKESYLDELPRVLDRVLSGEVAVPRSVTTLLVERVRDLPDGTAARQPRRRWAASRRTTTPRLDP